MFTKKFPNGGGAVPASSTLTLHQNSEVEFT